MILFIGTIESDNVPLIQQLYTFCSELFSVQLPVACWILYPSEKEKRNWLYPFIQALRTADLQRVNLLVPSSQYAPEELDIIEGMGITEFILLEDDFDFHFISSEKIGVRVWLNWDQSDKNQEKMANWNKSIDNLLSVEAAPFRWIEGTNKSQDSALVTSPSTTNGSLEHVVISIASSGYLQPNFFGAENNAPADMKYASEEAHPLLAHWQNRLPLKVVYNGENDFNLINIPSWVIHPDWGPDHLQEEKEFHDFIGGDLAKLNASDQKTETEAFLSRVLQNAKDPNR